MNLPSGLRNRITFAVAGALIGAAYAAYDIFGGGAYPEDYKPTVIGAILGGFVFATLLWPKANRSTARMIVLGVLIAFMAIWVSQFAVGFFSEREITSREQGLGTWVFSFLGSVGMGAILTLFSLLKTFGVPLLLGGVVGWLFRDCQME